LLVVAQGVRNKANKYPDMLDYAFLFCTEYYKGNFMRYDYVVVDVKYNNGTKGRQFAQVICNIDVRQDTLLCLYSLKQFLLFRICNMTAFFRNDERNDIQNIYKQLKWEQLPNSTGIAAPKFSLGSIDSKNIADVFVVIPFFSYYKT